MKLIERRKNSIKKRLNQKKILVVGGYGVQNVGDEAQLSEVLERLKRCFPEHRIKVLTPDPEYTYNTHDHCSVGEAPKVAFFHKNESLLYSVTDAKPKSILHGIKNSILKALFIIKSGWIRFNAALVKANMPTFLLGAQASALLYDLLTSDLLYFEGGGYLTGATLSRLWDGILLCRIANSYNVPVAMSGQTMGVWNNRFNRRYAKKGFKNVKLLSLRDSIFSPQALAEIGISGEHVFPVCDDALFCKVEANDEIMEEYYAKNDISKAFREKGYVAFSAHYWGLRTAEQKQEMLKKLHEVVEYTIKASDKNIIFIPMVPEDLDTMSDYEKTYPSDRIRVFRYDFDFKKIRRVIKDSNACVTMKHHPIIFAVGEKVPVISLNCSAYYEHKNKGALNILNVEDFSMNIDKDDYYKTYCELFDKILKNSSGIVQSMDSTLTELAKKMEVYEQKLKQIV